MELAVASPTRSTAYLLVSHGSRDPRPQAAMDRLCSRVRTHLQGAVEVIEPVTKSGDRTQATPNPASFQQASYLDRSVGEDTTGRTSLLVRPEEKTAKEKTGKKAIQRKPSTVIVKTACLELAALPLSQHIYKLGTQLIDQGVKELKVLPVFLMSGVHVMEDIPTEIEKARTLLDGALTLTVCPHLGSHPDIPEVLADRLASVPAEKSLLVAHGSRRPKGNRIIEGLAKRLDTAVAYWATPPDIETQVIELMQQGHQKLTILPYFLFAGGITDAITHRTEELAERFPKVQFRLLPTLGATDEVASLAIDLMH